MKFLFKKVHPSTALLGVQDPLFADTDQPQYISPQIGTPVRSMVRGPTGPTMSVPSHSGCVIVVPKRLIEEM